MFEIAFEQVYPIALRAARVRATAAVVNGGVPIAGREDLEQESLTACWRALGRFDPARASLRTFIERVIATRLASMIRTARRGPELLSLKSASAQPADFSAAGLDLRADVERVLASLGCEDRQLALLLYDHSPAEIGRLLGIPRSTMHDRIVRLRRRFVKAGLGPSGNSRCGGRR